MTRRRGEIGLGLARRGGDPAVMVKDAGPASLPAPITTPASGVHQLPAPPVDPLKLLLPFLDLLVVTLGLPLLSLLGSAAPRPRLGPCLRVPGWQRWLGLL